MNVPKDKLELGRMVAKLRHARGRSQADLGAQLGIDKTAVNKIESGKRTLSGSEALLLSRALQVDLATLLGRPATRSAIVRATAPELPAVDSFLRVAEGVVRDYFWAVAVTRYLQLDNRAPVVGIDGPHPQRSAAFARGCLGLGDGPLPDLLGLCQQGLGIPVTSIDSAEGSPVHGLLAIERELPFVFINGALAPARQRFALAHLLGHWFLGHGEAIDTAATLSEVSTGSHRAACQFAAEFMLPRSAVDRWYRERVHHDRVELSDIVSLATDYGVEEKVALIQLEESDRVSKSRAGAFRKQLLAGEHLPYRMFELRDGVQIAHDAKPLVDVLVPIDMFVMLIAAIRAERITMDDAAQRLRYPADSLQQLSFPPLVEAPDSDVVTAPDLGHLVGAGA